MSTPFFQFKQFTVRHDRCAMKVGTDGVLLGAWSRVTECRSVLDIGTGTGLVALMLAQRSEAMIVGIELDEAAGEQAVENFEASPWSNRLTAVCADVLNIESQKKFDLIVSNPPYFEQSLLSPDRQRTNARHTATLTYESLLSKARELLNHEGRICMILPADKEGLMDALAVREQLFLTRKCFVVPKPGANPKRLLVEFSLIAAEPELTSLLIEVERHRYSDEYVALTKDFYLKM